MIVTLLFCRLCILSGRLFDKDGNVKQWWSSVDVDKFIERTQCFVDQYSNYTVPEVNMNVSALKLCICMLHSPNIATVGSKFAPGAPWQSLWGYAINPIRPMPCVPGRLWANVTSSTKPKVHNIYSSNYHAVCITMTQMTLPDCKALWNYFFKCF